MGGRRIGIFGGTFDPVHVGHLVAAVNARYAANLDVVLLVVANDPWQKSATREVTPALTRLAAVAAAVQGHEGLEVSSIEIERGGPSFTVDTVRALLAGEPDARIFLVLGSDACAGIESWHESDELGQLAELVVVNRPNVERPTLGNKWRVTSVDIPGMDISSTDLRNRLVDGRPLDFLIPDGAVEVLQTR